MKPNEYQCAHCGGTFEKGWSDEEASNESEHFFGVPDAAHDPEFVAVCEDCFQKMHPLDNPELVKEVKERLKK